MNQLSLLSPVAEWRIRLRPGMVAADHSVVKVFTSPTAFDGYVKGLRSHDVEVKFSSPYSADCQVAA